MNRLQTFKIVDYDFKTSLNEFLGGVKLMGNHLGPLLFQFADTFAFTWNRLDAFAQVARLLDAQGFQGKMVVELRHTSWFREDVYQLFRRHRIWWVVLVALITARD